MLISYVYDAWGNTQTTYHNGGSSSNATKNPYTYRGYYYDKDIYFYYLQTRYYDPAVGRFISPDDVGYLGANGDIQGYNLYAYCSNNPVMYVDPSGNAIISAILISAAIGFVLGGIYGGLSAKANNQNVGAGIVIGAVAGAIMGVGAYVASLYVAPIVVGQAAVVGGITYSAGTACLIGTGISFASGAIVGFTADIILHSWSTMAMFIIGIQQS